VLACVLASGLLRPGCMSGSLDDRVEAQRRRDSWLGSVRSSLRTSMHGRLSRTRGSSQSGSPAAAIGDSPAAVTSASTTDSSHEAPPPNRSPLAPPAPDPPVAQQSGVRLKGINVHAVVTFDLSDSDDGAAKNDDGAAENGAADADASVARAGYGLSDSDDDPTELAQELSHFSVARGSTVCSQLPCTLTCPVAVASHHDSPMLHRPPFAVLTWPSRSQVRERLSRAAGSASADTVAQRRTAAPSAPRDASSLPAEDVDVAHEGLWI
jgi:hypothetical protein